MDGCEVQAEKLMSKSLVLQSTKHSLSNLKRIESLKQRKDQHKIHQHFIRTALASVDSKQAFPKKKIFENSDEELNCETTNSAVKISINEKVPPKHKLFTSSGSESDNEKDSSNQNDDDAFRIKPQFAGSKGVKLLKLQARFKDDKRFQLDERFLESGCQSSEENEMSEEVENESTGMETERQNNLKVLQDVLGVHLPQESIHGSKKSAFRDLSSLRFDPTSENASKLEIQREQKVTKESTKKADISSPPSISVSQDRFFEISSSLKSAFNKTAAQDKGFCFLRKSDQDVTKQNGTVAESYSTKIGNLTNKFKKVLSNKDSLYYDSSDNDDEMGTVDKTPGSFTTQLALSEERSLQDKKYFFLSMDNQCIKDGIEFFHRRKTFELIKEEWESVQPDLMEVMNTKRHRAVQTRKGKPSKMKRKNFKNR